MNKKNMNVATMKRQPISHYIRLSAEKCTKY